MVLNNGTVDGGPNWVDNVNDSPIIADPDKKLYYRQPHFYAMAHFAKFLAPGSVRINSVVVSQNNSKAIVGAFRTAQNDGTVVIFVNNDDTNLRLTLEDTKKGTHIGLIEARSIVTYVYYD